MPTRTLDPEGEWIMGSHIGWEDNEAFFERVPARMLGLEGGGL